MISSNDFRPGVTIQYNNGIWQIVDAMHVKPGKGSAFVRTKMRNVQTGAVLENTFRAGEKLPTAIVEKSECTFSYKDGEHYIMQCTVTHETENLTADQIGEGVEFLLEGQEGIQLLKWDNKIIGCELPNSVELIVTECAPDERGDTSSGGGKPATLETGAIITVPFHLKQGDKIRVDTRTRKYVTRV